MAWWVCFVYCSFVFAVVFLFCFLFGFFAGVFAFWGVFLSGMGCGKGVQIKNNGGLGKVGMEVKMYNYIDLRNRCGRAAVLKYMYNKKKGNH